MADQFQIPQRNPQFVPPINPTDLANAYLNRQQNQQQYATGLAIGAGETANKLSQQALQNYLLKQQAKAGAFEAGGPALLQTLYGPQGQPTQPTGPQAPTAGSQPPAPVTPSQPAAPASEAIPETIQATLNHPTLGVHAQKILDLQKQMGQNAQMGKYGQTLNAALKDQLNAEAALMSGEQFQQGQARQQKQFEESQNAEESRFQRSEANRIKGQVAGEVSKERQAQNVADTATGLLNTFKHKFLRMGNDGNVVDLTNPSKIPGKVALGEKIAKVSGGFYGNVPAKDMDESRQSLKNGLTSLMTSGGRMQPAAADDLAEAMIPSPEEPTAKKIEKIRDMKKFIGIIKSGNANALEDFISTLQGKQLGRSQ